MANKIIHKHSSVITDNQAKLPAASQLEYGELAVNYADGVETISIKNTENEIVEFKSNKYYKKIIKENELVTAAALTDLDERINIVAKDVDDNEFVTASALTDLNDRMMALENQDPTVTSAKITDAVSTASGITNTANGVVRAKAVYEYAPSKTEVEDMEYVLTLSVTDLDSRVISLERQIATLNEMLSIVTSQLNAINNVSE